MRFLGLLLLGALCLSCPLLATETLAIDFAKDRSAVVSGVAYTPKSPIDAEGFLAVGAQRDLSLPAAPLLGENCGTILMKVRFDEPREPLHTMRTLLTLRTKSRLTTGFYFFGNKHWAFSSTDQEKTFRTEFPDELVPGKLYDIGFSWDGERLRVYVDGLCVAVGEQPLPIVNLSEIHIGPYQDGWLAPAPWCDDTHVRSLRVFNNALTSEEIAAAAETGFRPLEESLPRCTTIPPIPAGVAAPVTDGRLDDNVWSHAAEIAHLIQGNYPRKSGELPEHRFRLLYDDTALHVGFRTHFPPHSPFVEGDQRTPENEPEVWGSESVEFYIQPADDAPTYRFAGNLAGGYCEMRGSDARWNGNWHYAVSRAMKIDDSIVWEGEMTIPWKTLGLDAPPETAHINCCRSWKLPEFGQPSSLNLEEDNYGPKGLVEVSFRPAATLITHSDTNPNEGEYTQEITVRATTAAKVAYDLSAGKLDGSAAPIALAHRNWELNAGESADDTIQTTIALPEYDCLIYTLSESGKVVQRHFLPFQLDETFFRVTPLFFQNKLRVQLKEALMRRKLGEEFRGEVRLIAPDGNVLSRTEADNAAPELAFPRQELPAGKYTVVLCAADSDEVLAKATVSYPGVGEWEKLQFPTDVILPPFQPMHNVVAPDGTDVESTLSLRSYAWKDSFLPTQIRSLDEALLTTPVEILLGDNPIRPTAFQVTSAAPHRLDFAAESPAVLNRGWLEYDGVQWNDIELRATKGKSLALRIRMPSTLAKYLHGAPGGASWGAKTTMALSEGTTTLRHYPVLWIGNEEKGLCFFAESQEGWTHDRKSTFLIEKGPEVTTITIRIADKLDETPPHYGIGWLATPIRPFAKNYPYDTMGWSYAAPMNRDNTKHPVSDITILDAPYGVARGDLGSYFADTDDRDGNACANSYRVALERQCDGHRVRPFPYLCGRYLSEKYPEVRAYLAEWTFLPELAQDYDKTGHFIYDCCPASSASAFFAWKAKSLLERFPWMRGLYFDFGNVSKCSNTEHGCHGGFPLLAQREFYRRMALVQLQAGIESPVIVLHNTDSNLLPTYTFATHLLNGEHIRQASSPLLHDKRDILDSYGIEMFASELSSLPFGITNSVYMPLDTLKPEYGGDEPTDEYQFRLGKAAHAATLLHNTVLCLWRNHYGIFDKVIRTFENFGVGEEGTRFVGYWRKPATVTGAEDIYVSCHVAGNRVLAIVGHIGKPHVNQTFDITFNWKTLGVEVPPRGATDTMNAPDPDYDELFDRQKKFGVPPERAPLKLGDFGSKLISFDGKTLRLELQYHSFAIILLK